VLNAYVTPHVSPLPGTVADRWLGRLTDSTCHHEVERWGHQRPRARASDPHGAVGAGARDGAARIAREAGFEDVITIDVGGTARRQLVRGGEPALTATARSAVPATSINRHSHHRGRRRQHRRIN